MTNSSTEERRERELSALREERYALSYMAPTPKIERRIRALSERIWELQGSIPSKERQS